MERYRYLLRTAPPDAIEQAHAEAFARLTPEQRRMALEELGRVSSPAERQQASDDPRSLARMATRAEVRQPGILERIFGPAGGGAAMGFGGMLAGSLLGSIAGTVIGSTIAHSFFDQHPFEGGGDTTADADGGTVEDNTADGGFDDFGGDFDI